MNTSCDLADLVSAPATQGWADRLRGHAAAGTLTVRCGERPLPIDLVAAAAQLQDEPAPGPRVRFAGCARGATMALRLAQLDALAEPAPPAVDLPFALRPGSDGVLTIAVAKDALGHPRLGHADAHTWMTGIVANRVVVDLAALDHVNSVVVAWLLQLAGVAKPARLEVVNASRQAATQLNQLRLNHLMAVHQAP